jgi:amino acid adenylation domain-containing protein/non-ribosomal peptide synthase protein (TIGR01720 family)
MSVDLREERLRSLSPAKRALLLQALRQKQGHGRQEPRIPRRAETGHAPLSFAQERLWFLDQLEPGRALYNIPVALRIEGPLERRALALALGEIVRRHEALRTIFGVRAGVPVQLVQPAAPFELPVVDLSELPETAREATALRLAGEEAARAFDLARGPLLRGLLLCLAGPGNPMVHAAVLTMHHITSDGWSMAILVREVVALYTAFAQGRPSPLADLPVQYGDFAAWQHSWLHSELLENELSFWRRQLTGLPPLLELPADRPRPATQSYRGATRPLFLPGGLARQAEALARREGATMFMVLLSGFLALLARHAGQDDLAVGTPVAGRNWQEVENLIGFFVNTLVLRGDLSGEPSFRELLGRVRETTLAAHAHQDVPFERLVQALTPQRTLAHTPLFQVMFALQNAPTGSLEIPGLALRPLGTAGNTAKFDLTLTLEEHDGGLTGGVEYATDLFDGTTVDRLVAGFERLLAAALSAPELSVPELPLLAAAERWQILREWNDTRTAGLAEGCLHQHVAAQAARTPEAVAVELGDERWTYRRLAGSARRLARHLRELGVGPDVIVGLAAERSPAMVAGMLAVLEAGGAWLPLDPAYPAERLAFMLDDSGARVLLIQEHLLPRVPAAGRSVVLLDGRWDAGEKGEEPEGDLGVEVTPDHLAYVIYTSGSTGRPKGVMVPHRGVVNRLRWAQQIYQLGPSDAVLQKASFSFDFSVWECFAPLSAGARLVLAEPGRQGDGAYLVRTLREHRVTFVHFVPSMLAAFLGEEGVETCTSLRQVFSGGEALTPELRDRVLARLPAPLDNQYGPTEISIDTTRWVCAPRQEPHRVPIGRPIGNSRLYVVDPQLRPVPIGVAGELLVGGSGVTRGYLRMPALTAERFVPDPFAVEPGARLYRTGDLVRWTRAGYLEFLGRIDHQVKMRGFRIELGEIEAALACHPQILESAVLLREDRPGDQRLAAYMVPVGSATVETAELRAFLRHSLPEFMIPATFVNLTSMPISPNGKVDRRALPQPVDGAERRGDYLAPRTPIEELLAGIWSDLLRVEEIGVNDDFFELGGHSLQGIRLVARIREVLGVDLPIRTLFQAPTLAALAASIADEMLRWVEQRSNAGDIATGQELAGDRLASVIAQLQEKQRSIGMARIRPVEKREGLLPLSFAQQRLWFIDQLTPGSPLYNMPVALRVLGPLQGGALARSLSEIQRRHEALRTVFASTHGDPVQIVLPPAEFRLATVDLSSLPEGAREWRMLELVAEESGRPFDLSQGPLWRGSLIRLAPREHVMVLVVHHIVSDGWSMGVLVRELMALYPAFAAGRPSSLPELPVQYGDYAVWQRRWLQGEVLDRELAYWRGQLAGSPPVLELPADRPRPSVQTFRGACRYVELPAGVVQRLRAIGRRKGATLFMSLLAGFSMLLARLTGREDLSIGSPVAARKYEELEPLIGFFVNTLVLRVDLSGDPGFEEALARVREVSLAAYMHQEVPFEKLVEELAPERSLAYSPIFQILMVLQNAPREEMRVHELEMKGLRLSGTTAKFDLVLSLEEGPASVSGALEYNTDLFDDATMARLLAHFETLLSAAIEHPEARLSDLPLLGEAVRAQEALPLTPNGKVDRQSLPTPQWQGPLEGHLASRTPMEEVLEGIWAEILGLERVGVKESFFALGGHSLLATRVMSRVRRVFGVELPLRDLFEEPTVAGLAARIEAALRGGAAAAPPIMPVPWTGPLPLSFAQQRLWLIDQLEPDNPLYNLPLALRASGPLDTMALACSLGEIVRRHEALRTVFTAADGEPVQVVRPPGPFLLPVVDLSALPKAPREALALALTAEEARRPFDLSQGPLFRASLLRIGPEDHMALVTMHHIVGDGWSLGILVREVTALYTAHGEGRLSPLPELPVQYADFAVWQRSWLQGEVLEGEIAYWRGQLAGLPAVLELPTDRPRPAVQSFRGAVRPVRFSAELTRRVQALGRREGVTPFMVLLAGFIVLLSRHSGQSDLVVGSPVAGRNWMEIEGLIGFFVNTLVLRGNLSGEPSFAELLARVRETALAAQVHQDLPFDRLVEELAPERSLAHTPLFQAMFALQNAPVASLEIEDLRLRPVDVEATTAKFDLLLSLSEQGVGLLGTVEYATDLYDAATVDRLILQLERLLAAALGEPDRLVARLPLLSEAELQQVLREWNDTGVEHGVPLLLHLLIAEQAARMPGRVAVEQGSRTLTAGELETRAEWLARLLRRRGVRIEDRVAVCCERSPEMVVILLAVWKAGAAWLPLDPAYPAARLAAVLDDARPALLIAGPGAPVDLLSAGTVQCLDLAVAEREPAADSGPLEVAVTPDHLAYAIYTSGSTGRPKGVLVSHGALANHMVWMQRRFPLGEDDAVLQKTPFVFDAAIWEIFLPLLAGARLVLAPPGAHREPATMARELRERGVTVLQLVPSVLGPFLDEDLRDLPLQRLFCGGEALPVALCERVFDLLPGIEVCNLYGPTECTVDATFHPCRPGMKEAVAPLGRPVDNLWVRILDRWGQPMAPGQPGELCLGGAGLARGFLGRPDLTAERFVPDPCAAKPGARLYSTGDLVRQRADGTIYFLGRIDHQVKIRGLRIELGDVEAALSALPGVRQVVVMPREDRLVAWVAGSLDADHLRRELRERLPEAMVPNAFVILAELPVTPTGKVDRKALPAPQPLAAASGYAAPRTREEQILAEIWAQTLRVPRVGVNDNFFELGGDSILSVQIVARARQAGLSFTMRQVFEHQTVAALARHAVLETAGSVRAEQGPVVGEVPLTPIQRWFFEQGFADPQHFNQALLLETREPLAPAALERAMAAIVEHHDALRLRFASRAGDWRQENAPAEPVVPFHLVDLSALPAPRRVQALAPAAAALQAGFNLSAGPLTRLCLFEAGAGQPSRLLWVSHHLVVDGVSWRVLLEDLERAYRQAARGQRPGFPPKTTSFQEWARRLAAHAGSDAVADELEHWREIAGVPVPRLPVDFPSGGNLVGDEATVSFELSTEETADLLQTLPSVYHNRIDDALLSSLGRALAGWIGSPRLRLDLEGHGREPLFDDLDLSLTVGWFTSLYPVVLEAGDAGPDAALVSAKDRLRTVPGRGLGHGLLRYLEKAPFLAKAPSAEILFNYLGQVDGTLDQLSLFRASTVSAGPGRSPRAHRAYLLAIDGIVTEGRLRMTLTYGSRVHRRETMERLAAAYADTLRQLIQHGRGTREVVMVSGLEEEGRLLWSPLVPIQPLGDRAPLFCIHAIGGEVLYYYRLARELGADQPLYGLQARPMDGKAGQSAAPRITIEELAAEYLNAVRSRQPGGPYFLAGHSFGGVVAVEMARQLTASGEDVALLAILDQPVSAGDEAAEVDTAAVIGDMVRYLARGQGRTVELDADALRGLSIDHQLERGLEVLGGMEALGPGFDIPMLRGLALGWSSRATAVERYKVAAYPGRIILLRASDIDLAFLRELSPERQRIFEEDPTLGWGAVAAEGVEVHSVPGNHQTILEAPHVEALAGILRACIERGGREAGANALTRALEDFAERAHS